MSDGMEQATVIAAAGAARGIGTRASSELEDFDALVRNEQQRVYRLLLVMLHDEEAADTLTQDCFMKVFENHGRFRGECSVRTWVMRIAMNLARDYSRNRRSQFWRRLFAWNAEPEAMGEVADPGASPERTLAAREQLASVWSDVESLSGQQRAVFTLRFVDDMSIEQITEATGLRPGTVKSHLSRALAAIRRRTKERQQP
ncbi:MAG: sigma-70 family RNA polymerase sigma factor [Acidobacteriia bacterium]|nr:sigma-70 family RNA polymerase sigma factor [Terriglobia bacterium]